MARLVHIASVVLLGLAGLPAAALGIEITSCGQRVGAGEQGELRASLSCNPVDAAIHLVGNATLNLNGFNLAGSGTGAGVQCLRGGARCAVNGPGEISGFASGVFCAGVRLRVDDVSVRHNGIGISCKAPRNVELSRVSATDNGVGIEVRGGGGRLRGEDVDASRNTAAGIYANSVTDIVRLTAVANGEGGLHVFVAGRSRRRLVRLTGSVVADNDGLGVGYDVLTNGKARLVETVCDRGARLRVERRPPYATTVIDRLGCAQDEAATR